MFPYYFDLMEIPFILSVSWVSIDLEFHYEDDADVSHVIASISDTDSTENGWYDVKGQFVIDMGEFKFPLIIFLFRTF